MATSNSDCSISVKIQEPAATYPTEQIIQPAEPDYDLVEQPDNDLYCPVTLEILVEPHQTDCCGQHISEKAAQRIIRDGKPCPMCNNAPFKTLKDKFFKRNTINKLNVRCPHKKSGCEWTGELGDLNYHITACPKRPWKCQYCDFESTHDIGTNDHTPYCDNYPQPCPNQCEIGTIPRCQADSHLLECPLQLVECEFAGTGCDVKVPRRDLVGHMTESAQHHLMTAALLNLRLTRELHQKMEEKDQQIANLQKQVKEQGNNIKQQDTKFQDLAVKVEQQASMMEVKMQKVLLMLNGFSSHEFTLTEFTKQQANYRNGLWSGDITAQGWKFSFCVNTTGTGSGKGTHITAYIYKHNNGDKTEGVAILFMHNQLGDHGHHVGTQTRILKEKTTVLGESCQFFPLERLGYCADTNTQYLKNDCLKFRLFIKLSK